MDDKDLQEILATIDDSGVQIPLWTIRTQAHMVLIVFLCFGSDSSMDDKDITVFNFIPLPLICSDSSMDDKDLMKPLFCLIRAMFRFLYGR